LFLEFGHGLFEAADSLLQGRQDGFRSGGRRRGDDGDGGRERGSRADLRRSGFFRRRGWGGTVLGRAGVGRRGLRGEGPVVAGGRARQGVGKGGGRLRPGQAFAVRGLRAFSGEDESVRVHYLPHHPVPPFRFATPRRTPRFRGPAGNSSIACRGNGGQ